MHRIQHAIVCLALVALALPAVAADQTAGKTKAKPIEIDQQVTQGSLRVKQEDGSIIECPLKHTAVSAQVSGFIARVKVVQTFRNPLDEKIEAVYVFPLPHKSAVDSMDMLIGKRRIKGVIKRRAVARQIYEEALLQGQTAALLEQERPNIFTQSVGNIEPKQEIKIEITYVDVLEYDMGTYTFHFPMVVGPRFIPGTPTSTPPAVPAELQGKTTAPAPDTDRVPDASRITPPYMKPEDRNGHDISLQVTLNAGVPIHDLKVINHKAKTEQTGPSQASVVLDPADSIPNKDFILKYNVVGEKPEMAVLCNTDESGIGYFMMMIQPKEDEKLKHAPPREVCFLIDVSGSMRGRPTNQVKQVMAQMLKLCKPQDTVQLMTFAGSANKLFPKAVPVTPDNVKKALNFTQGIHGGGGTRMLEGVKLAINAPVDEKRVRIVVMLTDGYIGNEAEIVKEVGTRCGDQVRFWCLGIGNSVNRFLVDGVAKQGGGMSKILTLNEDPVPLAQSVMNRIHRAQLAKIKIDFGDITAYEVLPARIPELWAGRPVIVYGCYEEGKPTTVTVRGSVEGEPVAWTLKADFPAENLENEVLEKVWARHKIEELMHQSYYGGGNPQIEEEVTQLALDYQLMSQYTSFVAVDESKIPELQQQAQPPRRMLVPVPIPDGTSWEGFFGSERPGAAIDGLMMDKAEAKRAAPKPRAYRGRLQFASAAKGGQFGYAANRRGAAMPPAPMAAAPAGGGVLKKMEKARAVRKKAAGPTGGRYLARSRDAGLSGAALRDAERAAVAVEGLRREEKVAFDVNYTSQALRAEAQKLTQQVTAVLKEAAELEKAGDVAAASARYALAYLLDTACMNMYASQGQAGTKALRAIQTLERTQREAWAKQVPALRNRINLVVRDRSVAEALQDVAKAAGFTVKLLPGSEVDAASILRRRAVRIRYLDLRHATAQQALDWILRPVRMTWRVDGTGVVAGTTRRQTGASAWVYDVAHVALPAVDEINQGNYRDRIKKAQAEADGFLGAIQQALGDTVRVYWFVPGEVIVFGDVPAHAAASKLFADLADPKATLPEGLAALHTRTSQRATARQKARGELLATRERAFVVDTLREHSWRLLAAAARGETDLEALTELQIAWHTPEIKELLQGKGAGVVFRSLWAICEATKAVHSPSENQKTKQPLPGLAAELKSLASAAQALCRTRGEAALTALKEKPEDVLLFTEALYASLALRDDQAFMAQAKPLLTSGREAKSALASAQLLAATLLTTPEAEQTQALLKLVESGVVGDDMVALTALACRRAGGDAWQAFRAKARELLGEQPLSGAVVVLVNRLSRTKLPLVAMK